MKRIYSIIILPLLAACSHTPADHFVLHGTVPGAMDSTEVDLQVDNRTIEPIEGYIINGKFELKGQLPIGAVYARLSMNNNGIAERKGIQEENAVKYVEANIFIENGDLTFSTPHIDSLPQSFWRYDIRRENNYTLKGSAAHDVFVQKAEYILLLFCPKKIIIIFTKKHFIGRILSSYMRWTGQRAFL